MEKKKIAFYPGDIMIPQNAAPGKMYRWSVVACDQYTSEPKYWQTVEDIVGDDPSTLKITVPEVYLKDEDINERIEKANLTMHKYIEDGFFETLENSYVYVERKLDNGKVRKGVVGLIDLEEYSFEAGAETLVRATEGTVMDRIPPRVKTRNKAPLEVPHVMLLIDDSEYRVIEPLAEKKADFKQIYDFPLMQASGSVSGYVMDDKAAAHLETEMERLLNEASSASRYLVSGKGVMLFAVGDGNHSLAAAKTCYEKLKEDIGAEAASKHPARFAMVEVVNLHSDSLEFEPIHRVLFDVNAKHFMIELEDYYQISSSPMPDSQCFEYVTCKRREKIWIKNPSSNIAVGTLQNFIDWYLEEHKGRLDYIHGEDAVVKLASKPHNIGILLPGMDKADLFTTVRLDGALPRKTFSMGHARDKRFYLETRKIK